MPNSGKPRSPPHDPVSLDTGLLSTCDRSGCADAAGGAPGYCPALMDLWESGLPPTVTRSHYRDRVTPNIRMGKSASRVWRPGAAGVAAPCIWWPRRLPFPHGPCRWRVTSVCPGPEKRPGTRPGQLIREAKRLGKIPGVVPGTDAGRVAAPAPTAG